MSSMALSRLSSISRDEIEQYKAEQNVPIHHRDQWRVGCERLSKIRSLRFHANDSSLSGILDSMSKAPYDAVFLDYLQLVQSGAQRDYENVSATSKALAWHAHSRGPMVVALSQLNREIDRVPNTGVSTLRFPRLSDLKGSSQIEQDADAVMFLHDAGTDPERDRTKVQIVVEKNRYGRAGIVRVRANPVLGYVSEDTDEA